MSRDFHVYCRSCDSKHPFDDANHADRLMSHLIKHAATIAALVPLIEECPETLTFRVYYGHIEPTWFAAHLGHELVVRDEYGEILDPPPAPVTMAHVSYVFDTTVSEHWFRVVKYSDGSVTREDTGVHITEPLQMAPFTLPTQSSPRK